MTAVGPLLCVFVGAAGGVVVAGGVFAFLVVIGIVPRLAQRSGTIRHIPLYEDAMMLGGFGGALTLLGSPSLPLGRGLAVLCAGATGIFVGCLSISLAEVLDVIPVFMRRCRLTRGLSVFLLALALGKLVGALLYAFVPGFYA